MSRASIIAHTVLTTLKKCDDFALPEEQLATEVRGQVRPPAEPEELKPILESLIARRAISYIPDDLDLDVRKFLITETGLTILKRQP